MQHPVKCLMDSKWLAQRLGMSLATVERLRSEGSANLPPCVRIGSSYRYDLLFTEFWIQKRLTPDIPCFSEWGDANAHRFFS